MGAAPGCRCRRTDDARSSRGSPGGGGRGRRWTRESAGERRAGGRGLGGSAGAAGDVVGCFPGRGQRAEKAAERGQITASAFEQQLPRPTPRQPRKLKPCGAPARAPPAPALRPNPALIKLSRPPLPVRAAQLAIIAGPRQPAIAPAVAPDPAAARPARAPPSTPGSPRHTACARAVRA